jgi:hypothetical protein
MLRASLIIAITLCWVRVASAQTAPPFFGGGVVANSPTISTVSGGAVFDAQAVVSSDRKYVTIGARAEESNLIALRNFAVSTGPQMGFVGGVNPGGGAPGGFSAPLNGLPPSPDQIERAAIAAKSVLNQRGMFLLTH